MTEFTPKDAEELLVACTRRETDIRWGDSDDTIRIPVKQLRALLSLANEAWIRRLKEVRDART